MILRPLQKKKNPHLESKPSRGGCIFGAILSYCTSSNLQGADFPLKISEACGCWKSSVTGQSARQESRGNYPEIQVSETGTTWPSNARNRLSERHQSRRSNA